MVFQADFIQLYKRIQPADIKVSIGLIELKLIIHIIKTRLYLIVSKLLVLQRQLNQLIQC